MTNETKLPACAARAISAMVHGVPHGWRPSGDRSGVFLHYRRPGALAVPCRPQTRGRGRGAGFAIPVPTLFEKSGAEGTYRRFKFELLAIAKRNDLPGFDLCMELTKKEPVLRMTRRALNEAGQGSALRPETKTKQTPNRTPPAKSLPLFHVLTDETRECIRRDFPGWDLYALQAEFDTWIAGGEGRVPKDYQRAFYGFMRRHHARHHS